MFKTLHNLHYEQIGKEVRCIEDELPFEIPSSWQYARLGSLLIKLTDGAHSTPKYKERGIPFVSVKDISTGHLDLTDTKFISIEEHEELYKRCDPQKGDILLSKVGTTGIPVLVDTNVAFSLFVSVALLKFNHHDINPFYLIHLLSSPLVQKQCKENTKGVGNKNWVMRDITSTLIVIPPYIEQLRIVEKIKELESLIDNYKQVEEKLFELNSNIKKQLKKSILQYAIEGKLVPQDPNDEPASILLERIHKEKEKLIAEGKIKKDKNESIIYRRDNSYYEKQGKNEVCIDWLIPFDIPHNWIWTRLSNIANILGGYAFKSTEYTNTGVRVIRISDFDNGGILNDEYKCYHEEEALNKYLLKENDILLCMTGGTVGKVCINNRKTKQYLNQRVAAIRTSDFIYYRYIYKVITSNYIQNIINKSKTSTNDNISMDTIDDFLIPLPPFNEQVRICEAIDKI